MCDGGEVKIEESIVNDGVIGVKIGCGIVYIFVIVEEVLFINGVRYIVFLIKVIKDVVWVDRNVVGVLGIGVVDRYDEENVE